MAVEPLGSAMSFQAQTVQQKPEQQSSANNTEVTADNAQPIDTTTVSVKEVDKEDDQNQSQNPDGQSQNQQPSNDQLKKAVEQMNKKMSNSEAVFGIHEATNRVTIKIIDKDTKKVIKELPPEKTLDMIAKVWELAGLMVDEKR